MEGDAAEVPAPLKVEVSEKPATVQEFESDIKRDSNKDADLEDEQSTESTELTDEDIEKLEHEKRKQRREEKRKANLKLKSHYQETESDTTQPEPDVGPEPDGELETDQEYRILSETEDERNLKSTLSVMSEAALQMKAELKAEAPDEQEDDDIESPQLSSSDEEYYRQPTLKGSFKNDFLENFYFPSLSDISTESSEVIISRPSATLQARDMSTVDIGHFVDPLTGEEIPVEEREPQTTVDQESVEEEVEEDEESSSSISFDWPFPLDDEPIEVPVIDDNELAMEFLMEVQPPVKVVSAQSVTALETGRVLRENRQIVFDFLDTLVAEVVELAEYVDPDKILAFKLDKSKLLGKLHELLGIFHSVKQYNTDLNKKMFEYYRRAGQLRCFDPLPAYVDVIESRRLRDAMSHLDHLREKAAETKKKNNLLMASVTMDLSHVRNRVMITADILDDRIRQTLARKDCEILPRIVESELRRMQIMRNEISDSRLWLITRQHTLGRLIERKRNFDEITPELTMDQFLDAQRDVSALGTKVEERNHELIRMRDRCSKHVNQLAFIREKTSMISANLKTNKHELKQKIHTQNELRDKVFQLKIEHAHLKDQKLNLERKSGLLHKPALLNDFDMTVEIIETKRKNVKKLRNIIADLEARIAVYQNSTRGSTPQGLVHKRNLPEIK